MALSDLGAGTSGFFQGLGYVNQVQQQALQQQREQRLADIAAAQARHQQIQGLSQVFDVYGDQARPIAEKLYPEIATQLPEQAWQTLGQIQKAKQNVAQHIATGDVGALQQELSSNPFAASALWAHPQGAGFVEKQRLLSEQKKQLGEAADILAPPQGPPATQESQAYAPGEAPPSPVQQKLAGLARVGLPEAVKAGISGLQQQEALQQLQQHPGGQGMLYSLTGGKLNARPDVSMNADAVAARALGLAPGSPEETAFLAQRAAARNTGPYQGTVQRMMTGVPAPGTPGHNPAQYQQQLALAQQVARMEQQNEAAFRQTESEGHTPGTVSFAQRFYALAGPAPVVTPAGGLSSPRTETGANPPPSPQTPAQTPPPARSLPGRTPAEAPLSPTAEPGVETLDSLAQKSYGKNFRDLPEGGPEQTGVWGKRMDAARQREAAAAEALKKRGPASEAAPGEVAAPGGNAATNRAAVETKLGVIHFPGGGVYVPDKVPEPQVTKLEGVLSKLNAAAELYNKLKDNPKLGWSLGSGGGILRISKNPTGSLAMLGEHNFPQALQKGPFVLDDAERQIRAELANVAGTLRTELIGKQQTVPELAKNADILADAKEDNKKQIMSKLEAVFASGERDLKVLGWTLGKTNRVVPPGIQEPPVKLRGRQAPKVSPEVQNLIESLK